MESIVGGPRTGLSRYFIVSSFPTSSPTGAPTAWGTGLHVHPLQLQRGPGCRLQALRRRGGRQPRRAVPGPGAVFKDLGHEQATSACISWFGPLASPIQEVGNKNKKRGKQNVGCFKGNPSLRKGPLCSGFPIGIMGYVWPTLHFSKRSYNMVAIGKHFAFLLIVV